MPPADLPSPAQMLRWLSQPRSLREAEPLLSALIRLTPAAAAPDLIGVLQAMANDLADPKRERLRRAGYAMTLLAYFSPETAWRHELGGVLALANQYVPGDLDLIPYYSLGPINRGTDGLTYPWRLGSGTPYDRLEQLLEPPYT